MVVEEGRVVGVRRGVGEGEGGIVGDGVGKGGLVCEIVGVRRGVGRGGGRVVGWWCEKIIEGGSGIDGGWVDGNGGFVVVDDGNGEGVVGREVGVVGKVVMGGGSEMGVVSDGGVGEGGGGVRSEGGSGGVGDGKDV